MGGQVSSDMSCALSMTNAAKTKVAWGRPGPLGPGLRQCASREVRPAPLLAAEPDHL